MLDPANAAIPSVHVRLINQQTAEEKLAISDEQGRFAFQFLSPGSYQLRASKAPFQELHGLTLGIPVTETVLVELHLRLETMAQTVNVSSGVLMVQTDNSALGRIVGSATVTDLPLVTRNYTQIAVLSPGVSAGVFNAGELGSGGMPLSQISGSNDGIFVHGARSYDNNYQLDGLSVNDVQGSGSSSAGIPIPNPDAIAEFKMQTGLYDATYGRFGGSNISVVTKSGGNEFHGTLFEFFRNNVLNANDFFLNEASQPRADLKQNQYGITLGGPILKGKLFFFGSYQGTRQTSEGSSSYSGLELSVTKRLSHGFQLLTSYTFSKTLDTDGANINAISAGNLITLGNQKVPLDRWGRASTDRTHRFVFSGTWALPLPSHGLAGVFLGGWALSGMAIVQSGSALTRPYQCDQCLWDKRRSRATFGHVREESASHERVTGNASEQLFQ